MSKIKCGKAWRYRAVQHPEIKAIVNLNKFKNKLRKPSLEPQDNEVGAVFLLPTQNKLIIMICETHGMYFNCNCNVRC